MTEESTETTAARTFNVRVREANTDVYQITVEPDDLLPGETMEDAALRMADEVAADEGPDSPYYLHSVQCDRDCEIEE